MEQVASPPPLNGANTVAPLTVNQNLTLQAVWVAGFGIITLSKKHVDKANQFDKDIARHNREDRIVDMVEK